MTRHDGDFGTHRLVFENVPAVRDNLRVTKWSDRRGIRIEDVLAEILAEVPVAAAEARHQQQEAERQAALRRAEWEQAMEVARERYLEQLRRDVLDRQLKRWYQAQRIREYAAAITPKHGKDAATTAWVEWMQRRADELDPLTNPPRMPEPPDKIQPEDLRPYLKGRSPYPRSTDEVAV